MSRAPDRPAGDRYPGDRRDLGRIAGATATGSRHQPMTGETWYPVRGMYRSGSTRTTSTPEGSTPASSAASRSAAPARPVIIWIDHSARERRLARMPPQRTAALYEQQIGQSGSSPRPNKIRIADRRPPPGGGRSSAGTVIWLAASARSRSQPGAAGPVTAVARHEKGPGLTSLAATAGIGRAVRRRTGQSAATGQAPQAGRSGRRGVRGRSAGATAWSTPSRESARRPGLDLDRILGVGPAEPVRQPAEVRIHGDAGDPERVAEHHVRGLPAHPGELDQLGELVRDLAAVAARTAPGRAR